MKRALVIAFAVVLSGSVSCFVFACTSFAVYSDKTLYGMNFDYPPCEVRFVLEEHGAGLAFIGSFWMGDHYGRTVGMNSQGLFSSCQMVSPARAMVEEPDPQELYVWNAFYDGLQNCSCVGEVTDDPQLTFTGFDGACLATLSVEAMKAAWKGPFGDLI